MSKKAKHILAIIGISLIGLVVVLVVASIIVMQTSWFHNFVRQKLVSVVEEATGGTVDIGSFAFHWTHLRATVRNFVIHGTEPATAEVTVILPDSKVAPRVQIPLGAFESKQIPIVSSIFGDSAAVYNGRISVRVIDGEGRVTAYGSIIDMRTDDPTFVPAQ